MLGEYLALAFVSLRRSPGRSALTILGLGIGVAAFIAMLSFGGSARRSVLDQFEVLGTRVIKVTPEVSSSTFQRALRHLDDRDVDALRSRVSGIAHVVPSVVSITQITSLARHRVSEVVGTLPEFAVIHDWSMLSGGMFGASDMKANAKVCVIGMTPAQELFGLDDALGSRMTVAGGALSCRVVGVLAAKGASTSGKDLDDIILVPLSTYRTYLGLPTGYSAIEVEVADASPGRAQTQIQAAMRQSHRLRAEEADDFRVRSAAAVIQLADRTAVTLQNLLAAIAVVSLLVGGIGIMNIQLVSVAERTREIGIRAAVGASPEQILRQFLLEAWMLSSLGTALGALSGAALSVVVAHWMHWPRSMSPAPILIASTFGMSTGLLFGYLPARRAATLDPLSALIER